MKHAKLILFLALVLVISVTTTTASDSIVADTIDSEGIDSPAIEFKVSYEEHSTFFIYNDAEFETAAEDEEWDGEGTEQSPYLIQGYNITDSNGGFQIYSVSFYFEIRDCLITYPTPVGRTHGIYLNNATQATVRNCTINNFAGGFGLIASHGVTIDNCTITNANNFGVWMDDLNYGTFNDITIVNTGLEAFDIDDSEHCNFTNNRVYDSGHGFYFNPGVNFCQITGNVLHDNDAGIFLSGSNNCNISDNEVYDTVGAAIDLTSESDFCTISDNTVYNNGGPGIRLSNADNTTILDNTAYNNSYVEIVCGIDAISSANCTVIGNELFDNEFAGINLSDSPNWKIIGNTIYNNSDHGIYGDWTNNLTITGNTIFGNGWDSEEIELCGIYLDNVEDAIVDSNTIYNNTDNGIALIESININVIDNEIYDNALNGIYAMAENCNLTANTIYRNGLDGIVLDETTNCNITYNIIFDNAQYGVSMNPADQCWIYYNDIGWNSENAYDASNGDWNSWDNNAGIGNWWHDYSGSGNYTISGSFADNDTAPSKSMYVLAAPSMEYEAGTTGHTMTWTAYALNPDSYEFYVDDELFDNNEWDGSDIDIDVTGLETGLYDVRLIVYHISGHSFNETSTIDVVDTLAPSWDMIPSTPITVEFGDLFSYDANASDPAGLDKWWLNTSLFSIDSSGVITNATNLAVGDYGLIISVNDTLGHILSTTVTIQIRDTTSPVWVWSEDPQTQLLEFDEGFSFQLYVYDLSAIGGWSVNDTVNFAIDSNGLLTNSTSLESGTYGLLISVEDIYGNTLLIEISVTVNEPPTTTPTTSTSTTTPTTTPTEPTNPVDPMLILVLGGGGAVLAVVIVVIGVSKKRGA
ncbi:MAG: right-handed parallel beta-helix repeat-containing protein [Candidatus Thorarchaeota archaeon]|jgi:parallel beta-helix repeat protein